jgi:hypothetical protein
MSLVALRAASRSRASKRGERRWNATRRGGGKRHAEEEGGDVTEMPIGMRSQANFKRNGH